MTTLTNEAGKEIVVLTDAEIELIRIKREEEALAKAKREAEEQVRIDKTIVAKELEITSEIGKGEAQVEAAQVFFIEFPADQWDVVIKEHDDVKKASTYVSGGEDIIHWSKNFKRRSATIVSKDKVFTVYIAQHLVYSSTWSSRATNKGWTMLLNGKGVEYAYERKHLKRVSTLLDKVKSVRAAEEYKIKSMNKAKNRDEVCLELLNAQFPNASIVKDSDSNYSYRNGAEFRNWVVYVFGSIYAL